MDIISLGQTVCLLLARWVGGGGSCYQVAVSQSMGYGAAAGITLIVGFAWLAATRRFRT